MLNVLRLEMVALTECAVESVLNFSPKTLILKPFFCRLNENYNKR